MGLLLAQYEYQRAKQRVNVLEAKGLRLNNLQERYQKRIAKVEKQYSKMQSRIESKYTKMQSLYSSQITSAASTSALGTFNCNLSIFGINPINDVNTIYQQTMAAKGTDTANGGVTQQTAWTSACSTVANQLSSLLQNILSDLKDAEIEDLEYEEEQLMEPLTEKDNEIQSEIATNETMTQFQIERRDAAKSRVQDAVKNSVAHFGLGG